MLAEGDFTVHHAKGMGPNALRGCPGLGRIPPLVNLTTTLILGGKGREKKKIGLLTV